MLRRGRQTKLCLKWLRKKYNKMFTCLNQSSHEQILQSRLVQGKEQTWKPREYRNYLLTRNYKQFSRVLAHFWKVHLKKLNTYLVTYVPMCEFYWVLGRWKGRIFPETPFTFFFFLNTSLHVRYRTSFKS